MRGATIRNNKTGEIINVISIHAPHEGCDWAGNVYIQTSTDDFNPRTP